LVNHASHLLDQSKLNLFKRSHGFNIPIPKHFFNEDYPPDPKTFGERLRKARIDAGLLIKEFAEFIGVTQDTVINWKLRGMRPLRRDFREKVNQFIEN
jgi:DNA-binding XRE family transcriptional regulator